MGRGYRRKKMHHELIMAETGWQTHRGSLPLSSPMLESLHEGFLQLNFVEQGGILQSDACFWRDYSGFMVLGSQWQQHRFFPSLNSPRKVNRTAKPTDNPQTTTQTKPLRILKVHRRRGQPVIKTHVALHCMGGRRIKTWGSLMAVIRRTPKHRPHGEVWQADRVCSQTRSRFCRLRFIGISRLPLPQVPRGPPDSPD